MTIGTGIVLLYAMAFWNMHMHRTIQRTNIELCGKSQLAYAVKVTGRAFAVMLMVVALVAMVPK